MSIFAKKQESDQRATDGGGMPPPVTTSRGGYGIAEAIQLLRGLPVDQNPDLVVRVVRATLASLNVQLTDIIDDATRKQKATQERIASEHGKVAELEKQLVGAPQGDRSARGRSEGNVDREGAAAAGREGCGQHVASARTRQRRQRPSRDHAARKQVVRRAAQELASRAKRGFADK